MENDAMTVAADAAPMSDTQIEAAPAAESSQSTETRDSSARGAIDRAFEALEKRQQASETVDPVQGSRERNPDGTFKAADKPVAQVADPKAAAATTDPSKAATGFTDAPTRFSADAKAAWATAPEAVKAETTRAIRELETGIQQYQTAYEPFKDFDKQLKANGQTFKQVFDHYTGIENLLREDPIGGLDRICRNFGSSLQEIARHVLNQPQDQQKQQSDAYIGQLEQKIAALEQQVGGVTTTIRGQQQDALLKQVEAFVADPAYSRFDELSDDIVFFLNTNRTKDLKEAYELAERLNPAPVIAPQNAAPAATDQTSQTRKGQLSVTGAPASGSNPGLRKPPATAREAIDRAWSAAGL